LFTVTVAVALLSIQQLGAPASVRGRLPLVQVLLPNTYPAGTDSEAVQLAPPAKPVTAKTAGEPAEAGCGELEVPLEHVRLTGTDAGSNALFGSLQKITATRVHATGVFPLSLDQAQILMCTSNSTGGVMGKMIDAQSIVVASTATNWFGHEGTILRFVFWHSIALACLVGVLVMLQAYVFTGMIVH